MFALSDPGCNRLHDTFNKETLKAVAKYFSKACLVRLVLKSDVLAQLSFSSIQLIRPTINSFVYHFTAIQKLQGLDLRSVGQIF